MRTFFISDTHFSHKNIIKLAHRPFSSMEEMDEYMVRCWNEKVTSDDRVFHIGDFAWGNKAPSFFHRLNGKKTLILGNHDPKETRNCPWEAIHQYRTENIDGRHVVMFHYPIYSWDRAFHGSIHLHGHVHGTPTNISGNIFDVSAEVLDYSPCTLDEIMEKKNRRMALQELTRETEKLGLYPDGNRMV